MTTDQHLTADYAYEWTQDPWFPTNRHTKPRRRQMESTAEVSVPIVAADDAPIAYRRPTLVYQGEDFSEKVPGPFIEYRLFDGTLWRSRGFDSYKDVVSAPTEATEEWLSSVALNTYITAAEETGALVQLLHSFRGRFIIVDGLVWSPAEEPVYEVVTPSGFAQRGARIWVRLTGRPITEDDHAAPANYFPADQLGRAVDYLKRLAEDEDYTFNQADVDALAQVEVTGAHTPGSTWKPAPRLDYSMPSWNATPAEAAIQLKAFRDSVSRDYPELLVPVDDGFGAKYRIIDRTKLTSTQNWNYDKLLEQTADPATPRKR